MIGIATQEGLIVLDRVALDRDGIGFLGRNILDPAHFANQRGGRNFRGLEEHEGCIIEIGRMPRRLQPVRRLVRAQADTGKDLVQRQARFADHLDEGGGVGAVRPRTVGGGDVRRGRERNQEACGRLHKGKSPGNRLTGRGKRILPRHIGDDHPDLCR
jgi:hypothetical protein